MKETYNLNRFTKAQNTIVGNETIYHKALAELQIGRKTGHWIWFVFPQTSKPGMGDKARYYAIRSKAEAEAYLADPILGDRLIACTEAVLLHKEKPLIEIFGNELDAMKFLSSMRLFRHVGGEGSVFERALAVFENKL